jgi:phage tail-like protein
MLLRPITGANRQFGDPLFKILSAVCLALLIIPSSEHHRHSISLPFSIDSRLALISFIKYSIHNFKKGVCFMAIAQDRPYGNAQFTVEIPAFLQAQAFDEVLLPDLLVDVEEVREGNERARSSRKYPSLPRFTNLILRRGFTGTLELYQWWKLAADGNPDSRQTITIHLLNDDRNQAASWRIDGAFPVSYTFSPLNSLDGSALVETLEVSCDSVTLE